MGDGQALDLQAGLLAVICVKSKEALMHNNVAQAPFSADLQPPLLQLQLLHLPLPLPPPLHLRPALGMG